MQCTSDEALPVFCNALNYTYMQCPGGEGLPVFCNALHCTYMQCRGDWKVARVSAGRVCAAIPKGDDLTFSRGLSAAIPTEIMPPTQCFRQESSWFVEMIPTETIFF